MGRDGWVMFVLDYGFAEVDSRWELMHRDISCFKSRFVAFAWAL